MPSAVFEPAITATIRLQTDAVDRMAIVIGRHFLRHLSIPLQHSARGYSDLGSSVDIVITSRLPPELSGAYRRMCD